MTHDSVLGRDCARMLEQVSELFGWFAMVGFGVLSVVTALVAPLLPIQGTVVHDLMIGFWLLLLGACRWGGLLAVRVPVTIRTWSAVVATGYAVASLVLLRGIGLHGLGLRGIGLPANRVLAVVAWLIASTALVDAAAAVFSRRHGTVLLARAALWLGTAGLVALHWRAGGMRLDPALLGAALLVGCAEIGAGAVLRRAGGHGQAGWPGRAAVPGWPGGAQAGRPGRGQAGWPGGAAILTR